MSEHDLPPERAPGSGPDSAPRCPEHRVNRRAIAWWTTRAAAHVLVLLVALGVLSWFVPTARPWLVPSLIVLAVVGTVYALVMPQWRYRVHRWEVGPDAVYTQAGWFSHEWRVAPMSRVQTVDTMRGPLQRAFRLSDVTVTTASAAGPITIAGLDRDVAADLAHQLAATTQAIPGDAT